MGLSPFVFCLSRAFFFFHDLWVLWLSYSCLLPGTKWDISFKTAVSEGMLLNVLLQSKVSCSFSNFNYDEDKKKKKRRAILSC